MFLGKQKGQQNPATIVTRNPPTPLCRCRACRGALAFEPVNFAKTLSSHIALLGGASFLPGAQEVEAARRAGWILGGYLVRFCLHCHAAD